MSSSTLSSFWKEHASATLPGNCSSVKRSTSSALIASTASAPGSRNVVAPTEQHLLQRVAAQAEPQRLERDDLLRRDVPEIDLGPEVLHEPRLRRFRRRLPDDVVEVDRVGDLVDETGAHLSGRPEDAGGPALARLRDHLPGAGFLLFLDPLDPLVRREDDLRVLRPDLGEHREVSGEVGDQLELALARNLDRAVRDLDVVDAEVGEPPLEVVELPARVDDLEERAPDHDGLAAQNLELPLEVACDVGRAPPELDDRDVVARNVEDVLPRARAEPLVEDVRKTAVALDADVKGGHRAPRASPARAPARRGRASLRARRCRRSAGRSPSRGTSRGTRASAPPTRPPRSPRSAWSRAPPRRRRSRSTPSRGAAWARWRSRGSHPCRRSRARCTARRAARSSAP